MKKTSFIILFLVIFFNSFLYSYAESNELNLSECIKKAINNNPSILISKEQLKIGEGDLNTASSVFSTSVSAKVSAGREYDPQITSLKSSYDNGKAVGEKSGYGIIFSKKYRSGIKWNTNAEVVRSSDSLLGDPDNTTTAKLTTTIVKPLKRGADKKAVTSSEKAASIIRNANILELKHTVSKIVYNTANAYWRYILALRIQKIREKSEEQAKKLLTKMMKLAKNGEIPFAELDQVRANYSIKKANTLSAKQSLLEAKHALGIIMGIPFKDIQSLNVSETGLPEMRSGLEQKSISSLIDQALLKRADLIAYKKRLSASKLMLYSAQDSIKPKLDLDVSLGYSALSEDNGRSSYLSALNDDITGLNTTVSINYEWPVGNKYAKGILEKRNAQYRQAVINIADFSRKIVSEVQISYNMFLSSKNSLKDIKSSTNSYSIAVENEKKKLKLGASTLINVISIEDDLISSDLELERAKYSLLSSFAELQFKSGRLDEMIDIEKLDDKFILSLISKMENY